MSPYSADGEERKLAAHALLSARRAVYVRHGQRALLMRLLAAGTATADDVRAAVALPSGIDPVCLGTVPGPLARAGIIRRVGYRDSDRAAAHARPLSLWELADPAAARAWLEDHPALPDVQATLW
jgi:hypothetical protein